MAETISITVCGDGGCGKSSITLRLVRSQWTHEYDPTIEDSYSVTRTVDGLPYFLALTDTAGQEEYRGLWAASNLKSDAFLLVYDITNTASLETLDHFMEMIDMETEQRLENNRRLLDEVGKAGDGQGEVAVGMAPPVKIVAGNKCDLKDARVVSARQGLEWARKRGCGFMETSAREMVNIEETFALIVRRVVEARQLHYQQQISQGDGYPNLPPFGSDGEPHPISHSRTPPLTAHEWALDQNPEESQPPKRQASQWLSMGRALSRRITRSRNTGGASASVEKSAAAKNTDQKGRAASYDQGEPRAPQPKPPTAIRRCVTNNDETHAPRGDTPFGQQDIVAEEAVDPGWWKRKRRILCF